MNYTTKYYCDRCDDETTHSYYVREERWQDESISDDELSTSEYVARCNGDTITVYTCEKCFATTEEM